MKRFVLFFSFFALCPAFLFEAYTCATPEYSLRELCEGANLAVWVKTDQIFAQKNKETGFYLMTLAVHEVVEGTYSQDSITFDTWHPPTKSLYSLLFFHRSKDKPYKYFPMQAKPLFPFNASSEEEVAVFNERISSVKEIRKSGDTDALFAWGLEGLFSPDPAIHYDAGLEIVNQYWQMGSKKTFTEKYLLQLFDAFEKTKAPTTPFVQLLMRLNYPDIGNYLYARLIRNLEQHSDIRESYILLSSLGWASWSSSIESADLPAGGVEEISRVLLYMLKAEDKDPYQFLYRHSIAKMLGGELEKIFEQKLDKKNKKNIQKINWDSFYDYTAEQLNICSDTLITRLTGGRNFWNCGNSSFARAGSFDLDFSPSLYPNPTRDGAFELSCTFDEPGKLQLRVQDLSGRVLQEYHSDEVEAGTFSYRFALPWNAKAGIYLVSIVHQNRVWTGKILRME